MQLKVYGNHICAYEKQCIDNFNELVGYLKGYLLSDELSRAVYLINIMNANQYLRGYSMGSRDIDEDLNKDE